MQVPHSHGIVPALRQVPTTGFGCMHTMECLLVPAALYIILLHLWKILLLQHIQLQLTLRGFALQVLLLLQLNVGAAAVAAGTIQG